MLAKECPSPPGGVQTCSNDLAKNHLRFGFRVRALTLAGTEVCS